MPGLLRPRKEARGSQFLVELRVSRPFCGQTHGVADSHPTLELSIAAQPASVRLLRAEVLEWLQEQRLGDRRLAARVALATSEAVANVVRHAYRGDDGRVDLDAQAGEHDILIRVRDRGLGLGSHPGVRTGLGLPVIGGVANGVTVASDADGTTVSMRFALPHHARRARHPRLMHGHLIRTSS